MKRLLLASALAALPIVAHAADLYGDNADYSFIQDNAPSQPAVVGHLSLGVGYVDEQIDLFAELPDFDYGIFNGAGRANVNFGWLNLELETGGQAAFKDGSSLTSVGATGHLWGRTGNLAVGAYGGVDFSDFIINATSLTIFTVGGEAEAYLGAVTLGADIDYNWTDSAGCCGPDNFWTARAWTDLYVTPNTRIGAEINYASWDDFFAPGFGIETWGAAVDAEHRFAGTPISTWIEGRYYHQDFPSFCGGSGCDIDTWSGMIGFRVFMDAAGTTLHDHDKAVPWESDALDFRSAAVPCFNCSIRVIVVR